MLLALSKVKEIIGAENLALLLNSFSCDADKDIEGFLHNRAVAFEALSKSRTYLIFDEKELEQIDLADATIYGYISVALKVLEIPNDFSGNQRKKLDGFSSRQHGELIRNIPCYLIGQLARSSKVARETLTGTELINYACDIINNSFIAVGGRYILIECHDNPKLIQFYEQNHFREFDKISDGPDPMVQMLRKFN